MFFCLIVCLLNRQLLRSYGKSVLDDTVCPRSLGTIYIASYYMNWDKTPWTFSIQIRTNRGGEHPLVAPAGGDRLLGPLSGHRGDPDT